MPCSQQSLEEVRAEADSLFADIRERITAEYGYEWVQVGDEDLRPERNGYGGESMLSSTRRSAGRPPSRSRTTTTKLEVMADDRRGRGRARDAAALLVQRRVLGHRSDDDREALRQRRPARAAHLGVLHRQLPRSDAALRQHLRPRRTIRRATSARTREAQSARTGEPLEGLQMVVLASAVLSEADRAEFEEKLKDYPGFQ